MIHDTSKAEVPPYHERPSHSPIGLSQTSSYVNNDREVTLKFEDRLRTKPYSSGIGDYSIKDTDDRDVFRCKQSTMSLRGRKELCDVNGNSLFRIKRKLVSMHHTFEVYTSDEKTLLFTVKASFSSVEAKMTTTVRNLDGQEVELALRGDFFGRTAWITLGTPEGPKLGTISRNFFNGQDTLCDMKTYYLTVAPGVDAALMTAIIVCLDLKENEPRTGAAAAPVFVYTG
ncbi:hypothetical protein L218DRAFT_994229 [Marasmius fiardii PR-910]|nr:hypothetical protein L218DRAFT_994229 [Marasmius fiardii PR-910]